MSLAAAKEIWLKLKNPGHCPSVFQARIGPWKGLWFVSDLTRDSVENVWLEVNDSQQKFECHTEDYDEKSYDPRRMTFEVVSWSRRPSPSEFYVDYLPILEDRGVHRTCMKKFVLESLDGAREDLQTSLGSPETFLRWLDTNIPVSDETLDGKDVLKAMMPKSRGGKVKKLLEVGCNSRMCNSRAPKTDMSAEWLLDRGSYARIVLSLRPCTRNYQQVFQRT